MTARAGFHHRRHQIPLVAVNFGAIAGPIDRSRESVPAHKRAKAHRGCCFDSGSRNAPALPRESPFKRTDKHNKQTDESSRNGSCACSLLLIANHVDRERSGTTRWWWSPGQSHCPFSIRVHHYWSFDGHVPDRGSFSGEKSAHAIPNDVEINHVKPQLVGYHYECSRSVTTYDSVPASFLDACVSSHTLATTICQALANNPTCLLLSSLSRCKLVNSSSHARTTSFIASMTCRL